MFLVAVFIKEVEPSEDRGLRGGSTAVRFLLAQDSQSIYSALRSIDECYIDLRRGSCATTVAQSRCDIHVTKAVHPRVINCVGDAPKQRGNRIDAGAET